MYLTILYGIFGTQTVFHDHQGQLPAVVQVIQQVTQAYRVDLPAKPAGFQIRIFQSLQKIPADFFRAAVMTGAVCHIVAQCAEIHFTLCQNCFILRLHFNVDVLLPEPASDIIRVPPPNHRISAEQILDLIGLLGQQHIVRVTGQRIIQHGSQHTAKPELRVDAASQHDCLRTGDKLMMQCLIAQLFGIDWIPEIAVDTSSCHHTKLDLCTVDFVKGEPIFHLALVPLEDGLAVTQIMSDHLPVRPAALIGKCIRRFIVADGDHRLNTVLV